MSKYSLVASYYNMYTKTYQNEITINLPEINLSTLQNIDNFTSKHSTYEILQLIKKKYPNVHDLNHIAVKYTKNKSANPVYYRVLDNNPEFTPCTENNTLKQYRIGNQYITSLTVPNSAPLFQKEKENLVELIETKNLIGFRNLYPHHDNLVFLVTRYINTSYDDDSSRERDFNLIMTEFSRYITFRGWIINKEKQQEYLYQPRPIAYAPNPNPPKKIKKGKVPSIEENEAEYIRKFEEDHKDSNNKEYKYSYNTYQAEMHNREYLEEDKEEFLSEREVQDAYYGQEPDYYEENNSNIKRRRH